MIFFWLRVCSEIRHKCVVEYLLFIGTAGGIVFEMCVTILKRTMYCGAKVQRGFVTSPDAFIKVVVFTTAGAGCEMFEEGVVYFETTIF